MAPTFQSPLYFLCLRNHLRAIHPSLYIIIALGHFTQVIWKKSTEVGFGVGVKDNVWTICANYMPAGNMMSEFENNVPRLE